MTMKSHDIHHENPMKSHHSQEFRDLLHPGSDRLMLREVPTTGGVGRTALQPGALWRLWGQRWCPRGLSWF